MKLAQIIESLNRMENFSFLYAEDDESTSLEMDSAEKPLGSSSVLALSIFSVHFESYDT